MRSFLDRLFGRPALPRPFAPFQVEQLLPGEDRPSAVLTFHPTTGYAVHLTRWPQSAKRSSGEPLPHHTGLAADAAFVVFADLGATPVAITAARLGRTAQILTVLPPQFQLGTCTGIVTLTPDHYPNAGALLQDVARLKQKCPPGFRFLLLGKSGEHTVPWERAFEHLYWGPAIIQALPLINRRAQGN
jgi:hypothetical protein